MNDLETKLHDLLQDRATRPRPAPQAPPGVVRRARRRQVGTALVSAATAIAVIGGMVLGIQAFGRGKPAQNTANESSSGATRTVSVGGYRVAYPVDWALQTVTVAPTGVEPGSPEQPTSSDGTAGGDTAAAAKLALAGFGQWIQLSSLYPDHLLDLSCQGTDVPADGVVLQVRAVPGAADSSGGLQPETECPGGARTYSATRHSGNLDFQGKAMIGPDAQEADLQALLGAYDSIQYPSGDTGVIGSGGVVSSGGSANSAGQEPAGGTPSVQVSPPPDLPGGGADGTPVSVAPNPSVMTVVAGGTTASGRSWVMLTDPAMSSTEVQVGNLGFGYAWAAPVGEQPTIPDFDASVSLLEGTQPVVSGSVVSRATRVEVRPDGQDPIDVPLEPAPAVTGIERAYFLMELPDSASPTGTVVALDANGDVVGQQQYITSSPNTGEPIRVVPCPPVEGPDTKASVECTTAADGSSGQEPASGSGVEPADTAAGGGSSAKSGTATAAASTVEATASPAP